MSETDLHPDEQLQELIDGRLGAAERAAVEEHLAECVRCQRLHTSLLTMRRLLRATAAEEAPADLASSIAAAIAARGRSSEPEPTSAERPARLRRHRAALLALAAVLLVVLGVVLIERRDAPTGPDQLAELIALHGRVEASGLDEVPAALEQRLAGALPFRPRVLDLAMMKLRLVGGGTATVGGAPAAWMLYEGPEGRLLCAMYPAGLQDLPVTADVRSEGAFVFRVYRRGDLTVVAWQEGELLCALVSPGEPEAVVALAIGKAMLPA